MNSQKCQADIPDLSGDMIYAILHQNYLTNKT